MIRFHGCGEGCVGCVGVSVMPLVEQFQLISRLSSYGPFVYVNIGNARWTRYDAQNETKKKSRTLTTITAYIISQVAINFINSIYTFFSNQSFWDGIQLRFGFVICLCWGPKETTSYSWSSQSQARASEPPTEPDSDQT